MAYVDGLLPILFEDLQNFESIILTVFTSNGKFALEENAFLEKTGQEVYKTILEYDVTFWSSNVVKEEHFSSLLSNLVTALSDLEFLNNHLDRLQDTILPFQDINSSFLQVENVFYSTFNSFFFFTSLFFLYYFNKLQIQNFNIYKIVPIIGRYFDRLQIKIFNIYKIPFIIGRVVS